MFVSQFRGTSIRFFPNMEACSLLVTLRGERLQSITSMRAWCLTRKIFCFLYIEIVVHAGNKKVTSLVFCLFFSTFVCYLRQLNFGKARDFNLPRIESNFAFCVKSPLAKYAHHLIYYRSFIENLGECRAVASGGGQGGQLPPPPALVEPPPPPPPLNLLSQTPARHIKLL